MNRSVLKLTIDLLAAACLLVMVATGYILRFALPPTTNRTHELWAMSRHEWGTIHSWASIGLLAVLGIHVAMHWDWLFSMIHHRLTKTKAKPGAQFRAGFFTAVAFISMGILFAWAAHTGVQKMDTPLHPVRGPETATALTMASTPMPRSVIFERDLRPIFEASCLSCHGPEKQRANFRVDRREDFFAPGDANQLIVPGHAEKSRLIAIVSGEVKDMKSADEHLLPPPDIRLLRAWIDSGAEWPGEQQNRQSPTDSRNPNTRCAKYHK